MVDRILQAARASTYDFERTAFPDDPLSHRFEEWVPYYRLKWAIAKALAPRRILEIGVRYGYSALAFLDACPGASYLGIDLDIDMFGGVSGAINWARSAAAAYDAQFLVADSQKMSVFPGGRYNLIHVDGQQDGEGSIHDIALALRQSEYVLVDGYFWTSDNFWAVSECLLRYKDLIEFCIIIPGYAGELLIKTHSNPGNGITKPATSSKELQSTYTRSFYLSRLRGHDAFKRDRARIVDSPWYAALSHLAEMAPAGRALDLGCGRGELTVCLARQGRPVVAVDYSEDALRLAAQAMAASGVPDGSVDLRLADLNEIRLEGKFQVIAAADLIQRLSEEELSHLLEKAAAHLEPSGLFLVTARPSAWNLRFAMPERKRRASAMGAYPPSTHLNNPEAETFLNPPSPAGLKRRLKSRFQHSAVWLAEEKLPFEGLFRHLSRQEMREAPAVCAVASSAPLSIASLRASLGMDVLPPSSPAKTRIRLVDAPVDVSASNFFLAKVEVGNGTEFSLRSIGRHPVHLSYHWMEESGSRMVVYDGARTLLLPSLPPGVVCSYWLRVQSPARPGAYVLRVALVQEGVRWFDSVPGCGCATAAVKVR
jgi:2-polyprenyl-3-methyl-5-hydroxy-6-metoxy-1,4-benzoquinol methylase